MDSPSCDTPNQGIAATPETLRLFQQPARPSGALFEKRKALQTVSAFSMTYKQCLNGAGRLRPRLANSLTSAGVKIYRLRPRPYAVFRSGNAQLGRVFFGHLTCEYKRPLPFTFREFLPA